MGQTDTNRAVCSAIKPNGERCKVAALPGATVCWGHDPSKAATRKANATRGGKTSGHGRKAPTNIELDEIRVLLKGLTGAALKGTYERGTIAVVNQILQTRLKIVELERKLKETEELEARLQALEAEQDGATRLGA